MGTKRVREREVKFTKKALEALKPPAKGRAYVYDAVQAGLAVCITQAGSKTFYRTGRINGRAEQVRLGVFPEMSIEAARKGAQKVAGEVAAGNNPRRPRRYGATIQDLFGHWMMYARAFKKSWAEDERQFERYFQSLKNRRLSDITTADVVEWNRRIGEKHGPVAANRARALLCAMYNRAYEMGQELLNPCRGVRRFPEESRDRYLTPDEVPRFFAALGEVPDPAVRDFLWLALLTGARKSNVLGMRWDQLTVEGVWRIPSTKSGKVVLLPLVDTAQNILRARKEAAGNSPWVFPARTISGHLGSVNKPWRRLCERAGLGDLRIHDLRRTLGSWQAAMGVSELVIGKSLGHAAGSRATSVYARLGLEPVRRAVEGATNALLEAGNGVGNGEA
jgi:integrase